ncbi:MAG: AMP-binding protein [Bradymonadaceae bacterium]|nr:AMP-binding protein [Lujinxingiaceae bacterium]
MALKMPEAPAILFPLGRDASGKQRYETTSYKALDEESDCIAAGLIASGIGPGTRATLMVKPSTEFFALTFALFKAGIVPVLVDPGIGIKSLNVCLDEAEPQAFIGITSAHVARSVLGWGKRSIRTNVTVGRRLFWGGLTLEAVKQAGREVKDFQAPGVQADDIAAIIFTSGSTGVPKGAIYTHGNFMAQVEFIGRTYAIEPGEVDLPTFPLFALFDPALGMTTIIPEMDATRPANVEPRNIIEPILEFGVTNMFGSPALLNRVSRYGVEHGVKLPTLRRVISAGAPVPAAVLERFTAMLPEDAQVFTPYGATESLPVASIGSNEILEETRHATDLGKGVCIGRPVEGVRVEVIGIDDEAIDAWSDALRVEVGVVGEFVVMGPQVTTSYHNRDASTRLAKIKGPDGQTMHRMGDVGYFDEAGRMWFCGRKTHRVITAQETMFTIPCEAIFNTHKAVYRTALVGVSRGGQIKPVLCVEREATTDGPAPGDAALRAELLALGAAHAHTASIADVLFHKAFPVDIRHNSKIFREKLAVWADKKLP